MQRALTGAVLLLLFSGCAVIDANRVREMSSNELKEAFQPCVGPFLVLLERSQTVRQRSFPRGG